MCNKPFSAGGGCRTGFEELRTTIKKIPLCQLSFCLTDEMEGCTDLSEAAIKAGNLDLEEFNRENSNLIECVIQEDCSLISVNTENPDVCDSTMEDHFPVDKESTSPCNSVMVGNLSMDAVNEDSIGLNEPVTEENIPEVTVKEEIIDPEKSMIGDNLHSSKKRQPPKKRRSSRRKRLTRQKNGRAKRMQAVLVSNNRKDVKDHLTDAVPNELTLEEEMMEQSEMPVIKQEALSPSDSPIDANQTLFEDSAVRQIIFKRDTFKPNVIVATPVTFQKSSPDTVTIPKPQPPSLIPQSVLANTKIHPIHKVKSVFLKCFNKPDSMIPSVRSRNPFSYAKKGSYFQENIISKQVASPLPDIHSVTKNTVDLSHFIYESTGVHDTFGQSSPADKQTEDSRINIPVAFVTQFKNIPTEHVAVHSGNIPLVTPIRNVPVNYSETIPTSSRNPPLNRISLTGEMCTSDVQQSDVESTDELLETVGQSLVEVIPAPWITVLKHNGVALCLLSQSDIVTILRSLLVEASGKVTVGIHGKELPPDNTFWQHVKPIQLRQDTVEVFIENIKHLFCRFRGMEVCKAVEEFEPFWKTVTNCHIDMNRFHEFRFKKCCRSQNCQLLVRGLHCKRCTECSKIRSILSKRASADSRKPETPSLKKPFKNLTSLEKRERFEMAVKEIRRLKVANKRLSEKLNLTIEEPEDSSVENMLSNDAERADQSDSD